MTGDPLASRSLGRGTVAALPRLRGLGCDDGDGYHIGRPKPQAQTFGQLRAVSAGLAFDPSSGATRQRPPAGRICLDL